MVNFNKPVHHKPSIKTAQQTPLPRPPPPQGGCMPEFSLAPGPLVNHRVDIPVPSLGNGLWLICITITHIRKATDWSTPCQIMMAFWMKLPFLSLNSCWWYAQSSITTCRMAPTPSHLQKFLFQERESSRHLSLSKSLLSIAKWPFPRRAAKMFTDHSFGGKQRNATQQQCLVDNFLGWLPACFPIAFLANSNLTFISLQTNY